LRSGERAGDGFALWMIALDYKLLLLLLNAICCGFISLIALAISDFLFFSVGDTENGLLAF
jgi:hypothetical protein